MASVTYDDVSCVYPGATAPSLSHLDIEVKDGEFLVLVGPSGCGKSTTLRLLAGLETATSGKIVIGGEDVTNVEPRNRDIAMVFQNYALYPHMTVAENIAFSLKIARVGKAERHQRVLEAAKMLDLEAVLDRKPSALSGGQRQRVAMGRAVVRHPKVFLMDEPLSNLDAKLRVQTRTQILRLTKAVGTTTVYVTHDQTEAMTMGDRVAVLKDGELQQIATPAELYEKPCNLFVAGFIGSPSMNLMTLPISSGTVSLAGRNYVLPVAVRDALGSRTKVVVGIRPEQLQLSNASDSFAVDVDIVEELGSDSFIYAHADVSGNRTNFVARGAGHQTGLHGGIRTSLTFNFEQAYYFDAETEQRIEVGK